MAPARRNGCNGTPSPDGAAPVADPEPPALGRGSQTTDREDQRAGRSTRAQIRGRPLNIVLLHDEDWLDAATVRLRDRRAVHIREQLKAAVGDSLRVGQLGGRCGLGLIEAISAEAVTLRVALQDEPPPRHRFEIVLALPRPKMLRRILRQCAEFGVEHLHLINSARVEKSFWQSPLLRPERVQEALLMGLERSRDTLLPSVHLHKRFRPFVEDRLPALCAGRSCWIAEIEAPLTLAQVPPQPAVVMIGPEGGFVPFELALAEAMQARRVGLGSRLLSVDTAFTTVLAQALPAAG